jgi:hypothetical protein
MVGYACNPTTVEAEARGLGVRGQPELHSETLPPPFPAKKASCEDLLVTIPLPLTFPLHKFPFIRQELYSSEEKFSQPS